MIFFRILLTKHPESNEAKQLEILMRERFGAFILQKSIVRSVEIEKSSSVFCSVYEIPKQSTKPYKRAIESFNNVFYEVIDAFIQIWEAQSNQTIGNAKLLKEIMNG